MYTRNIADIIPKWKDIRIADIIPNGSNIHQLLQPFILRTKKISAF